MNYHTSLAKYVVWAALVAPALHILYRYAADTMSYGQVIHETGDWSVGLLFAALAVTPLRRIAAKSGWLGFLRFHRRAVGVASFGYAALHTVVYLERKWGADLILAEAMKPGIATGWIALAIYVLLAITSNNLWVRKLGRKWKTLHRTVYASAALVFAHWILTSFNSTLAYVVLVALCLVEALRWLPAANSRG